MSSSLFEEAIADAKKIREVAEENAKKAEEAITKMEDGEILNGNISRNILTGDQEKSDGTVNEKEGTSSTDEGEPTFQFKEVSPPVLPTKSPLN